MEKTLILGYGNCDRQDDGVAWHILLAIASQYGKLIPPSPDEGFEPEGSYPHLLFLPQLTPETAEVLTAYDQVCFVDAHTGSVPEDVHSVDVFPAFTSSPFTHHLTPSALLELVRIMYKKTPCSRLVSIRGYRFEFQQTLSTDTASLLPMALKIILDWIDKGNSE